MYISEDQIIAVLDVETTGLSPAAGDRICEVGIVRAQGDVILDTYQTLVNPQRSISAGAAQVNGLSDEMVRLAPTFAKISGQVLAEIDQAVLVCHNAPFDLSFLDNELARLGLMRPLTGVIDTLEIARRHFRFTSNGLSVVARHLGIKNIQAHRALGDALTTFYVFRAFYSALTERGVFIEPGSGAAARPAARAADTSLLPLAIQDALRRNQAIEIIYLDAQEVETRRRVTPILVQETQGNIYLVAYCHLRQAERSFRLDRIVTIEGEHLRSQD